jgi:hypothetical protein
MYFFTGFFHTLVILSFTSIILKVNGLNKYCSTVSQSEFKKEFAACQIIRSPHKTAATQSLSSSGSVTSANRLQSDDTRDTIEADNTARRYAEVIHILERVLFSLEDINITRHETKLLFLDIVRMITIVNDDNRIKFCMRGLICNLFKNCEFPMEIEYSDWSNDAIVAARLAALLTVWTANERVLNNTYLTQLSLYSLLRSTVADYANIYDSKIVLPKMGNDGKRYAFEATKNIKDKSLYDKHLKITLND